MVIVVIAVNKEKYKMPEKTELSVGLHITVEDLDRLEELTGERETDFNSLVSEIVHESINREKNNRESNQRAVDEATVTTLEMVYNELKKNEEIQKVREDVAADLLVAKVALEYDKTGNFSKENLRSLVKELCF